jgi:hypothetical protein
MQRKVQRLRLAVAHSSAATEQQGKSNQQEEEGLHGVYQAATAALQDAQQRQVQRLRLTVAHGTAAKELLSNQSIGTKSLGTLELCPGRED